MKLKQRVKSYGFWVSMASAILLIISALGKKFNFSVDENLYNDLFAGFCAILVLLGVIVPPSSKTKTEKLSDEEITEEILEEQTTCIEEEITLEREDGKIIERKND